MVFLIECVVLCVLFTVMIKLATAGRRDAFVNDYPPVVTDRLRTMGLIAQKPPAKKADILRKLVAMAVYAALFSLLLRQVNGADTFLSGALTAYALWLVVDWYDFLVVDVLLAPFDQFYRASGVSAFDRNAVWFHFKGSCRGMLLGIPFALVTGLLVML